VSVDLKPIGTHEGEQVREAFVTSDRGVSLAIIGYGARVRDWRVPVGGTPRPVVLGFDDWQRYVSDSNYFGAIAGRVANRIGNSRFTLDGREYQLEPNEGRNHLHGGPKGLSDRVWTLEPDSAGNAVKLAITSGNGDMGYPGAAEIEVVYALAGNRVSIAMTARVSEPTPVNLVQHHYFNLAGEGDVLGHRLQVEADRFTPVDEALIPTGEIAEVAGTENDFRAGRTILGADGAPHPYDLNLVLRDDRDVAAPAVRLTAPDQALTLRLWTEQPGVQFYNGAYLDGVGGGLDGRTYSAFGGACLEDQGFPDAPNHPGFPSILVTPDVPYAHRLEIEIG
jgi:aldose 1-epimerase